MEIVLHCLLQLRRTHSVGLRYGLLHGNVLVLHQIEVGPGLRQLFLVEHVMHNHPRLRIEERVVGALLISRGVMLHGE